LSLASEVSAFRETSQLLRPVSTSESWLTTFTQFAALKFFGHFTLGQNLIFTHTLQSTGMLAAHQITFSLGLTTKPQGDLFSQFIHAELSNLQMSAGMAFGHLIKGGRFLEREAAWEIQTKALQKNLPPSFLTPPLKSTFALAGGSHDFFSLIQASKDSQVMRMAKGQGNSTSDDIRFLMQKAHRSARAASDLQSFIRLFPDRVTSDHLIPLIKIGETKEVIAETLSFLAEHCPRLFKLEHLPPLVKTARVHEVATWALVRLALERPDLAHPAIEGLRRVAQSRDTALVLLQSLAEDRRNLAAEAIMALSKVAKVREKAAKILLTLAEEDASLFTSSHLASLTEVAKNYKVGVRVLELLVLKRADLASLAIAGLSEAAQGE